MPTQQNAGTRSTYWLCVERRPGTHCYAAVIQRGDDFIRGAKDHIHPAQVDQLTKTRVTSSIRRRARRDVFRPASTIVQEAVQQHWDPAQPVEALPQLASMRRAVNKFRAHFRPKAPTDLSFDLDMDNLPENFVQCNVTTADRRHLILATDDQLDLLTRARRWYMDGTFHIVRRPFVQLFSIHVFLTNDGCAVKQAPLVFVLMSGRSKRDYRAVSKQCTC